MGISTSVVPPAELGYVRDPKVLLPDSLLFQELGRIRADSHDS